MKCPSCGTCESKVKKTLIHIEQEGFDFGELKRRRRECITCGSIFHTCEIHESVFKQHLKIPSGGVLVRRPLRIRRKIDG